MARADFQRKAEVEVRFRDVDLMGHVNNAVYFTYLEQARFYYFRELSRGDTPLVPPGAGSDPAGSDYVPVEVPGFIVASAKMDYKSAARQGEWLDVLIRVAEVRRSSFVYAYEIYRKGTDELVATAETVQVVYDYAAARSTAVPDSLRSRFEVLEGRSFLKPGP